MSQLFEMSLNCVRIVAELRQKVTTLWVSWRCRGVSWGSRKLYFLYTYVADRLELFQCSLKSATMWPESRHLTTLFSNTRPLHDTLGVVRFKSIKGLIPRVLRDRPWIFSLHDTFPDFSAQNRKKIKKTSLGIAASVALFQTQLRALKISIRFSSFDIYRGYAKEKNKKEIKKKNKEQKNNSS